MKKTIKRLISLVAAVCLLLPSVVYARHGDGGYEGGISSGEAPGKTQYEYQEVCFLSGEPVVLTGTLTVKKTIKQNTISTTYTYELQNIDKSASLRRTLTHRSILTEKDNGQIIEEVYLTGRPSETVRIGNTTYTLSSYDFTKSSLLDPNPAIHYFAGNLWGKKIYRASGGNVSSGTVIVEVTGNYYGYDQYWGNTEVQTLKYLIQSQLRKGNIIDRWGGTADVVISASTSQELKYIKNEPEVMSFEGGYLLEQKNSSIMEYDCRLPEFDSSGISTGKMIRTQDSLKIESFPVQKRLPVPQLNHLRGHPQEEYINKLFSLEVFKGNGSKFYPSSYMTRAEFTAALVEAAKEVPSDLTDAKGTQSVLNASSAARTPATATARYTALRGRKTEPEVVSPFLDVSVDDIYFSQIESAYKRGLVTGVLGNIFKPNEYITVAEALTAFINALGLENLAPNPVPVTTFRDNDEIPLYARKAVYVAEKTGIIEGDKNGYLRPNSELTKGQAAQLLSRFIDYMRQDIRRDFREHIVNYY